MKFSANLGFLYTRESESLIERYSLAKADGFFGVETPNPYCVDVRDLQMKLNCLGLHQVAINSHQGGTEEIGLACLPDKCQDFREYLELSINYAKALDCKKIHILSGLVKNKQIPFDDYERMYISNIKHSVERLLKEDIMCLIEPINNRSVPCYFLDNFNLAKKVLKLIECPNLKLQFDFFHAQIINGDLTQLFKSVEKHIGHIQIAQVPDRGHPGTMGEINYDYILEFVKHRKYDGWIGLEYK
ncbi:hypothetical protein HELRODRAFT_124434, partial [Helobdella robusta]|uniref:Putative hydroxypyruvate isomerase n=1 Tax=Helobdella robusta TaxID=6412 RepID=T1EH13_HELRO